MTELLAGLEARLGHVFANPRLLEQALTHKSFCGDPGHESAVHNEKLEFLGDAVVDLAVATLLMRHHPEAAEGVLTRRRAALVNQGTLAAKALGLGLDAVLRLGNSEECSDGRAKPSLLSDAFEAVLGALYLDAGWYFVLGLVEELFLEDLCEGSDHDACSPEALGDYKSALQELTQAAFRCLPVYTLLAQRGPEHLQMFAYEVRVGDRVLSTGEGNSKKRAQQEAARAALERLREVPDPGAQPADDVPGAGDDPHEGGTP